MKHDRIFVIVLILLFVYYKQHKGNTTPPKNLDCIDEDVEEVEGWEQDSNRDAKYYIKSKPHFLPKHFCNGGSLLVVMVHSKPTHFHVRNSIRETWGRQTSMDKIVSVFFLLGETEDHSLQDEINVERELFNDIIQESFIDSYNNLTLKSLMMLKLASIYCYNSSKYLLKVDDDTVVNSYNLLQMLDKDKSPDLLMGALFCDGKPQRNLDSKWYAPYYLYPEAKYPHYLSGSAYLMSLKVVKILYEVALQTPIFHMEDIYVTGICAEKAKIKPQHNALFFRGSIESGTDECLLRELYTVSNIEADDMVVTYYMLIKEWPEKCAKPEEEFFAAKWIYNSIFKPKDNLFGYRKLCP